jgi:hypothetical protein
MKIILEAEVMDQEGPRHTPSMYMPGCAAVRLKVQLGRGTGATCQEFTQDVILRLDEVQSVFDLLMKNLTRNMRDALVSYLEDRSYLEKFPLMPVLKFERMRG